MSGAQTGQIGARANWISAYPFEPYLGGLGVAITASIATANVALQGVFSSAENVNVAVVFNTDDTNFAFVRFGDGSITATTACMAVPPQGALTVSLLGQGAATPTYMAAITSASTVRLQVTTGWGN